MIDWTFHLWTSTHRRPATLQSAHWDLGNLSNRDCSSCLKDSCHPPSILLSSTSRVKSVSHNEQRLLALKDVVSPLTPTSSLASVRCTDHCWSPDSRACFFWLKAVWALFQPSLDQVSSICWSPFALTCAESFAFRERISPMLTDVLHLLHSVHYAWLARFDRFHTHLQRFSLLFWIVEVFCVEVVGSNPRWPFTWLRVPPIVNWGLLALAELSSSVEQVLSLSLWSCNWALKFPLYQEHQSYSPARDFFSLRASVLRFVFRFF